MKLLKRLIEFDTEGMFIGLIIALIITGISAIVFILLLK
jgi:hypothetical protein